MVIWEGPIVGDVRITDAMAVIRGPSNARPGQQSIVTVRVGDVTNDGLGDVVIYRTDPRPIYSKTYVYESPLSGDYIGEDAHGTFQSAANVSYLALTAVDDFDGDGIDDLGFQSYIVTGPIVACPEPCIPLVSRVGVPETHPIMLDVADATGDGQPDLLMGGWVADTTVANFGMRATASLVPSASLDNGHLTGTALGTLRLGYYYQFPVMTEFVGDFDGDGLADYLATEAFPQSTRLYLGASDSAFEDTYRLWTGPRHESRPRGVGDVNDDGFDDILFMLEEPFRVVVVFGGVRTESVSTSAEPSPEWVREAEVFLPVGLAWWDHVAHGDLNGDGVSDFAVVAPQDRNQRVGPSSEYVAIPVHYGGQQSSE